jgi:rare lipoprotein A (peptidoglycan hydrolase)
MALATTRLLTLTPSRMLCHVMSRCTGLPIKEYEVFGKTYVPVTQKGPYKESGVASWYGRKFHGQKTSSGERYDMYGMTAAHPTLPIPSYVRVTNKRNNKSVVVLIENNLCCCSRNE